MGVDNMNKYGNGNTAYFPSNNWKFLYKNSNYPLDSSFTDFGITTKRLLSKIEHDNFHHIKLVYDDSRYSRPHIRGYENGLKRFTIHLSKDDAEAIRNGTANKYLKALVDASTRADTIRHFEYIQKVSKEEGKLPQDINELKKYKEYLEQCKEDAEATHICNTLLFHLPFGISIVSRFVSGASYLFGLSSTGAYLPISFTCSLIDAASLYLFADLLFMHRHIMSYELFRMYENNTGWTIKECENELFKVDCEISGIEYVLEGIKDYKKEFYLLIKKAVSVVNELPEEERKEYYTQIRRVVKDFNANMKKIPYDGNLDQASDLSEQSGNALADIESDIRMNHSLS